VSLQCQKVEIKKIPFLASDITNFTSAVCAVVLEMSSYGEPIFETWANTYSADLYSSYTTVYSYSSEWGSADSSVNSFVYNTSANILSVNSIVNTHSANWDSVYSEFNSVSSNLVTFVSGDARYVKLSGDVMFGGLSAPSISANTLYVGNSTINFFDENFQVVENLKGSDVTKFKSNYNTVNSKSALWDDVYNEFSSQSADNTSVYNTVQTYSSTEWNYQGNDIKALTGDWEDTYNSFSVQSANNLSVYNTVNSYSATEWNYQGNDIKALTSNWEDTYTKFSQQSANNIAVYNTVNSYSATTWNYQGTDIKALTSNWENTYNVVSSSSANWNNVYSVVQTNSSQWAIETSIDTGVRALTSNWENTYNTVNTNSGNWNYQGTDIKALTSNWENTYTGFSTQSANNNNVYSQVNSKSANWDSTYSIVQTNSSQWAVDSTIDSGVRALTSNWQVTYTNFSLQSSNNISVYSTVQSNSATIWNYQGTDVKILTANWENTYTEFSTQSANNTSVYTQVYTESANWANDPPQTLSFNEITLQLSISDGNTVSLSSLSGGNSSSGEYLPLSGGTLTGDLNIQSNISSVNAIQFNTATAVTVGAGQMAWNSAESTLDLGVSNNVTLQMGQEILVQVKNSSGEIIYNGAPVYAVGASGTGSGNITVSAYKAGVNDPDELYFLGVATEQINVNDFGFVTTFGKVRDVKVSEVQESLDVSSWPIGTILYPSAIERGKLTSVPPNAPNKDLPIVIIISVNGSNRGFFVRAEHGYHLNEIHDVTITNPINSQVLSYNSASGVWTNASETDPVFTSWANSYSGNYQSVYNTVNTYSATQWNYQGTDIKSLTSNWQASYTALISTSGDWNDTRTTVNTYSSTWGTGGGTIDTGVRALTSNWQDTYTAFSTQSANNSSVYTKVNSSSANWDSVYTNVNSNSANAYVRASIGITIDGGGSAITTGSKGFISIPYSCTIINNTIVSDQSGSIVIDVKKATYAGFPTTTSICAAAKPTLSSSQKSTDSTLTGWTTTVNAGDILEFYVDSASTVTRVTLTLGVNKFT